MSIALSSSTNITDTNNNNYNNYNREDVKSDPLFYTHVKMCAASFHKLGPYKKYPEAYDFYGHPITKVEIMGVVVTKRLVRSKTLFVVDDGTGLINCILWNKKESEDTNENEIELGHTVHVWGKLSHFRDQREITIFNHRIVDEPNGEILAWLDLINVTLNFYEPTSLPPS